MPITKSAKKALRKSLKNRGRNYSRRRTVRKLKKDYSISLTSGDKKLSAEKLQKLYKAIDKATKRNIIHKNKANRLKSSLAKKLK